MKKIFFIMSLLLFLSCESKRVLFVSEFKNVTYEKDKFLEIVEKYNPTIDMDKIVKGTSKTCYGIDIENPVYFCQKGTKMSVISFYKITDNSKSFELNYFYQDKRNKYEEESFNVHEKIAHDISKQFSTEFVNQLVKKQEMKNKLESYKD